MIVADSDRDVACIQCSFPHVHDELPPFPYPDEVASCRASGLGVELSLSMGSPHAACSSCCEEQLVGHEVLGFPQKGVGELESLLCGASDVVLSAFMGGQE